MFQKSCFFALLFAVCPGAAAEMETCVEPDARDERLAPARYDREQIAYLKCKETRAMRRDEGENARYFAEERRAAEARAARRERKDSNAVQIVH